MNPQCLLDMDGVLVDFMGGAMKWFGLNPDLLSVAPRPVPWDWIYQAAGYDAQGFWDRTSAVFWEQLEWTADGGEILTMLEDAFQPANICLLTNPSGRGEAIIGKRRWVAEHLPGYVDRILFGAPKHFCAAPWRLLVDDSDANVDMFVHHGGRGLLVPRPWNRFHHCDTLLTVESNAGMFHRVQGIPFGVQREES